MRLKTDAPSRPRGRMVPRSRSAAGVCSGGFTLIELMIVVAIIAVLSAIAYPAYTNSVIKGKRAEGRAALLGLLQQEERYFTQNNTYLSFASNATTATDASGNSNVVLPFQTFSGSTPSQSAYSLSATTCTSGGTSVDMKSCVVVQATPNFTDTITQLSIQSNGARSCTVSGSTSTSVCWGGS